MLCGCASGAVGTILWIKTAVDGILMIEDQPTTTEYMLNKATGKDCRFLNDPETLNDINREVWAKKVLKSELDTYIDSDTEMIQELLQLAMQEEKVNYLTSIIKRIENRNWEIRNAIEWNKFQAGG